MPSLLLVFRGIVVAGALALLFFALRDDRAATRFRAFFSGRTSAINLGLFRIVVFSLFFFEAMMNQGTAVWFAGLPTELRVAPPGTSWLVRTIPLDLFTVASAQLVFGTACILAIVGLFTRVTGLVAVIFGIYVLGIPQLFGKLNHYHHVIWFAAIVASAPSARALSLDAIRRTRLEGLPRLVEDPVPRTIYALPLRLCWVIVGLMYFFPGLWKAWNVGHRWIAGDYVKLLLHEKWLELGAFEPLFRVDHYPVLYRAGGLFTIAFELSFVFLLFFPRLRGLAIASGLAFHLGTKLMMDISFISLVLAYVMFIDCVPLLGWIGRRLPAGFRTLVGLDTSASAAMKPLRERASVAPSWAGSIIIAAMLYCGFLGIDSWPMAVYPRFHYHPRPHVEMVSVEISTVSGERRMYADPAVISKLHSSRWVALLKRISRTHDLDARRDLLVGLLRALEDNGLEVQPGDRVTVFADLLATTPERRGENPLARRTIARLELAEAHGR